MPSLPIRYSNTPATTSHTRAKKNGLSIFTKLNNGWVNVTVSWLRFHTGLSASGTKFPARSIGKNRYSFSTAIVLRQRYSPTNRMNRKEYHHSPCYEQSVCFRNK